MLTSSDGYGLSTRQRGFINGSVAGSIAAVTLQPLDLLKTRLQAQRILPEGSKTPLQLPVSLRLLITRIAQSGGARVLWSGTAPSLARGAIGPGIYFVTLEEFRSVGVTTTALGSFMAAALARCVGCVALHPLTVLKTRAEAAGAVSSRNPFFGVLQLAQLEGLRGLYAGLIATMVRDVPFSGLYFLFYSKLRGLSGAASYSVGSSNPATAYEHTRQRRPSHLINFSIGSVAGLTAALVTQPFDVIKTWQQLTSTRSASAAVKFRKKDGVIFTMKQILASEGSTAGLLRGLWLRVLRRSLTSAITWTVWEALK